MLLIFSACLLLLACISLGVLLRRSSNKQLLERDRPNAAAEHFRPLFAPTDEELRLAEAQEKRELADRADLERREAVQRKLDELNAYQKEWRAAPTRAETIELLRIAAQTANSEAYLSVCDACVEELENDRLADITAADLAELIETHYWLLPADARTPGAYFRLKESLARLKAKPT